MFQASKANKRQIQIGEQDTSRSNHTILSKTEVQKSPPECTSIKQPTKGTKHLIKPEHHMPKGIPRRAQTKLITIQHPDRQVGPHHGYKMQAGLGQTQRDQARPRGSHRLHPYTTNYK